MFRMSRASLLARLPLYCSAECATPTNSSLFANFPRNLANAPFPPESFRTCFVCATHAHSHFCPQHWLLCHLGLYLFEFEWLRGRTIGALRAERHTSTSAEWTSCSACHELLCSRAFLLIVLRSAQHPQIPRFLQIFRGIWPMPFSLLNHSALALFAQRTRIPTTARSIGFCAIRVCISSSSSTCVSVK